MGNESHKQNGDGSFKLKNHTFCIQQNSTMSLQSLYNDTSRLNRELADMHKKLADETRKELDKHKQIDSIQKSITSTTPASTVHSKMNQIRACQTEVLNIKRKIADLHKKQSDITQNVNKKRLEITKEEQRERDKVNREQIEFRHKLQDELNRQTSQLQTRKNWVDKYNVNRSHLESADKEYDFFISYASEDKDYADTLYKKLTAAGKKVWLDSAELTIGDSLRIKIDEGLRRSRFGIVILSQFYFKKFWTNQELSGLVAKEVNGRKIILPIWHKVTRDDVFNYSPTLVDKFAFNSSVHLLEDIIQALLNEATI